MLDWRKFPNKIYFWLNNKIENFWQHTIAFLVFRITNFIETPTNSITGIELHHDMQIIVSRFCQIRSYLFDVDILDKVKPYVYQNMSQNFYCYIVRASFRRKNIFKMWISTDTTHDITEHDMCPFTCLVKYKTFYFIENFVIT